MVSGESKRDSDDITGLVNIKRAGSFNNHSRNACQIRNEFIKNIFVTKGQ